MRRRFLLTAVAPLMTALALATAVMPSASAAHKSATAPKAASPWTLVYSTNFPTPIPKGSFAGCTGGWATTTCTYLPDAYKPYLWAYPYPWADTATKWNYPVGGYYDPSTTLWADNNQLHIKMWRGPSGPVHSAAVLPRQAINKTYGKFVETWRVSQPTTGYKSAHLLWPHNDGNFEVDYPENEWDTEVCAYIHSDAPSTTFCPGTNWTSWHTTEIDWKPGSLTFLMDGNQIGYTTSGVPNVTMDWILQNESALNGEQAALRTTAQMDISNIAYYAYTG